MNLTRQTLYFTLHKLLFRDIVISGWIYPHGLGYAQNNFGDDINIPLLKALTGRNVVMKHSTLLPNSENLLCIGSIIENFVDGQSIIWGSGAISGEKQLTVKPKKVCAVRGPLTRQYLLNQGIDCPEIYGDPALLLPLIYKPKVEKKYRIGIIPHYSDFSLRQVISFKNRDDVLLIDMRNYTTWQEVIKQILSCDVILSSSLHGLILSDAYGVPNIHIKLSNNIKGGEFKYRDYYEGVGREYESPIDMLEKIDLNMANEALLRYSPILFNIKPLLTAFPYKLKIEIP